MQQLKRETFAAMVKTLIVFAKYEPEKDKRKQYSDLIGRLKEKYGYNPMIWRITETDEFKEFRKVKDRRLKNEILVILAEGGLNTDFKKEDMEKYKYLTELVKALLE